MASFGRNALLMLIFFEAYSNAAKIYFQHGNIEMVYLNNNKEKVERGSDVCKCKCYNKVYKTGWGCCECPWTDSICFPGDAIITLDTEQEIKMEDLRQGHKVLGVTTDGRRISTEVKTFLKRLPDSLALYLDITTEDNQTISLSESHVILTSKTNQSQNMIPNFAGRVNVGDFLFTTKNCHEDFCSARIKNIIKSVRKGAYVPLTEEGTLVVNAMAASCYSSIAHNLAHFLLTPIRRYPWLLGDYQQDGYSPIISALKNFGHWILPNNMQFNMEIEGSVAIASKFEL